ncbi:hypothetical protein JTE90_004057 [Oedothorax gibbosus]|uniref:Uncharacterized protein n=1 Tax=Oedothorax gibbosus TaxID=931172 RepID=A0AAV6U6G2_9ARAC|nr:hypothetical protein JTE90_004057 [Oedothorax gibbosus]
MSNQSPKAYTPPRRGHTGPVRSLIAGLTTIKSTHNNFTKLPEGQGAGTLESLSPKAVGSRNLLPLSIRQANPSQGGSRLSFGGAGSTRWLVVHCSIKSARRTSTGNRPRLSSSGPMRRSHVCRLIPTRRHQVPPARWRSSRGHAGLKRRLDVWSSHLVIRPGSERSGPCSTSLC